MDQEQKIIEELAGRLPKPDIPDNEQPKTEEVKTDEKFVHDLPPENQLERSKLMDYFEVLSTNRHNPEIDKYLSRIIDWARDEAKSSEYTDLLRVINDQERVMGSRLKPDRMARLYQFVKINTVRKKLIEEERALYG